MAARNIPWISPDEYLDAEEKSDTKHTYYAGVVTSMAGGSSAHAFLTANLVTELRNAVRRKRCRVASSDLLVQSGTKELYSYPDVGVYCGPVIPMPGRPHVMTNPIFVAEVLSPSTEAFDRGVKSREYRATPSVQQYALLSQDGPLIEIHTRDKDGVWRISECSGLDAICEFSSLDCRIPMADLYDGALEE